MLPAPRPVPGTTKPSVVACKKCRKKRPIAEFVAKRSKKICKLCKRCRDFADARVARHKNKHPDAVAKSQAAFSKTDKAKKLRDKEKEKRQQPEEKKKHADNAREYRKTDAYKKTLQSDAHKESKHRSYIKAKSQPGWKQAHCMLVTIGDTLGSRRSDFSNQLREFTEFTSIEDVKEHFEQHDEWQDGMSWDNHSHQGWNVGHKIARAHYGASVEDLRRAYKKANLFPQWATGPDGNCALHTKFPPTDELLKLRSCWPVAWNDKLPSPEQLAAMEHRMYQRRG